MKIGGKEISNWWLIAGGGVAVVGVWFLYKKGASSNAASSTDNSASSAIDPLTGLPVSQDNTIDPLTGMTYLQEAQQYGSVQAAEQEVSSGAGYYGSAAGYGGSGYLDSGYPTISGLSSTPAGSSFSTNAAWAQAVTAGLVSLGYSSTDVAAALGLFFAQQPLGSGADGVSYTSIIQAAEAEYGPPPQGTYNIIPQSSTSTGTGTTGSTGTITVPNVVSDNYEAAAKAITAADLVVSPASSNGQASGISGGGWVNPVTAQSPAAGTQVASGSTVAITGSPTANPGGTNQSTGGSTGTSTGGAQAAYNSRPKSVAAIQALPTWATETANSPKPQNEPAGWHKVVDTRYNRTVYESFYGINGKAVSGPIAGPGLSATAKGVSSYTATYVFTDTPESDFVGNYNIAAKGGGG